MPAQFVIDKSLMMKSLNNLGVVYRKQGRIEDALVCYQEARYIGDEVKENILDRGVTFNNLGYAYYILGSEAQRRGNKEEVRQYYKQAYVIFRDIGAREDEGRVLQNLGYLYLFQKKYELTLACFVFARDILNDLQSSAHREIPRAVMTELHLTLGEQELRMLMEKVEQQAEQIVEQALKRER